MKKTLCLLMATLFIVACFVLPAEKSDLTASAATNVQIAKETEFDYDISKSGNRNIVTIYAYNGKGVNIAIPEKIAGYPVTHIESFAFTDSPTLEYIQLPSTTEYVGPGAFYCSSKLKEIAISANNKYYTCSGGVLYNKDMTTLVAFPAGKGGAFIIPKSVVTIGELSFYNCYNLTNIKMYNNVLSIGNNAFDMCWNLSYIKLSDNLQLLGQRAIAGCRALTSIHLPYSLKNIAPQALLGGIDSKDNMFYYFTNGIYYVKGTYTEKHLKTLHLPTNCLKAETRYITDIDSSVTIYDSAGVFPADKKLDLSVAIKPNTSYTPLMPVRHNIMKVYQISFLQNGTAIKLPKECVVRFHGLPANTIPTATKIYVPRGGALVEKTRAPQAAFVGTTFIGTDTFVVITNNNFSIKGDIDGDGTRTIYDARFALCLAANLVSNVTDAQKNAANADGKPGIQTTDATEILRYAAGIK